MIPATVAVFLLAGFIAYAWGRASNASESLFLHDNHLSTADLIKCFITRNGLALAVIVIALLALLGSQPMPESCIWSQWC